MAVPTLHISVSVVSLHSPVAFMHTKSGIDLVVFFLSGDSPASEFYVPTFRSTLSVPSS